MKGGEAWMIRFNKKEMDKKLKVSMEVVKSVEESRRIRHEDRQKAAKNT